MSYCSFNNPNRQIPKPIPYPSPCPRDTLSPYPIQNEDPTGFPPNVPWNNPGSPNPLPGQWDRYGYHGFPQVPGYAS